MNEVKRAAYRREYGLYREQLDLWKGEFESMGAVSSPADRVAFANGRKKSKRLARDSIARSGPRPRQQHRCFGM